MTGLALTLLTPIVVGPLTFLAMQGIKATNALIDAQSPLVKRVLVAVIAVGLTNVAALLGVNVQCDPDTTTSCLAALDKEAVKAMVAAAVAYAVHFLKNVKKG